MQGPATQSIVDEPDDGLKALQQWSVTSDE
jgi:hypothetical protein